MALAVFCWCLRSCWALLPAGFRWFPLAPAASCAPLPGGGFRPPCRPFQRLRAFARGARWG
eukprot:2167290-Alexandrium_andersonii.AAC.1